MNTLEAYYRACALQKDALQLVEDLCLHTDPRCKVLCEKAWQRYRRRRVLCDRAMDDHWGPLKGHE